MIYPKFNDDFHCHVNEYALGSESVTFLVSNLNVILKAAFSKYMILLTDIYDFVDGLGLRRTSLQWVASLTMV